MRNMEEPLVKEEPCSGIHRQCSMVGFHGGLSSIPYCLEAYERAISWASKAGSGSEHTIWA